MSAGGFFSIIAPSATRSVSKRSPNTNSFPPHYLLPDRGEAEIALVGLKESRALQVIGESADAILQIVRERPDGDIAVLVRDGAAEPLDERLSESPAIVPFGIKMGELIAFGRAEKR